MVGMFIAAIVFMLINILVLPLINTMALANYQYYSGYMLAYEIVEFLSVAVLLSLGTATAFISKKSEKFGVIYIRMGVAAIVFALVYLIMDFFPINDIIKSDNENTGAGVFGRFPRNNKDVRASGLHFIRSA